MEKETLTVLILLTVSAGALWYLYSASPDGAVQWLLWAAAAPILLAFVFALELMGEIVVGKATKREGEPQVDK
jgi:multisubunit Na+/H+ antiporter MnhB subunit